MTNQLKHLSSKVIYALSSNNFNAVFSRVSSRYAYNYNILYIALNFKIIFN